MARVLMMTDFSESYANKLLSGIMRYSHEHEPWTVCKVPLSLRDSGRMQELVNFATRWKADAVIGQFRSGDPVEGFLDRGIITLAQDFQQRFPNLINISGDYYLSGEMAADYFIEKGVRYFAFYGIPGMVWSEERLEGFSARIRERLPDATVSVHMKTSLQEIWWYDTDSLTEWLAALPKPVAILGCDDNIAYQIIEAITQVGREDMRIPDDILVMGVDNDASVCQMCSPQLSSINQEVEHAGYQAAALIDELLAFPPAERRSRYRDIIVKPSYITTRQSTDAYIHQNPYVSKVMYYVNENLGSRIKVESLVDLVPMSRRMLETTFARETGISLYQYIIRARVNRMKDLINAGHSPLQAADELGTEYKIIARNFKNLTGMTPAEYAKKQLNSH
ncbi:MAG: substrate-binding domain-containing protein [Bacteroidales bacterium]|nr:substrate-binding domain-containing protein [Bacteroidales bacterium]